MAESTGTSRRPPARRSANALAGTATAAAALALATFACGCSGPSLDVSFSIPTAYRHRVATLSLDVLAPPAGSAFSCDDVAFSEVSAATIDATRVQEVSAGAGDHVSLTGIPRTGAKLFVARGFNASGTAVVAGCAEVGDVDASTSVTISGRATTVLTAGPRTYPGQPLPGTVTATVTDTAGVPLAGRTIRWDVAGPGGEESSCKGAGGAKVPCTATTGKAGTADIMPPQPSLPGPAAFDVRARWQNVPAKSILGFYDVPQTYTAKLPGDAPIPTDAVADAYRIGGIGPDGQTGLAVLSPNSDGTAVVAIAYYEAGANPPFKTAVSAPITGAKAIGIIAGSGRDRVFTITPASWLEIGPDGAIATRASPAPGKTAQRIVSAGGCSGVGDDVVLVEFEDGSVAAFDRQAQPATTVFTPKPSGTSLLASGCAADLDSNPHRVVVYSVDQFVQTLVANFNGTRRVGRFVSLQGAVGFLPAIGDGAPLLLGEDISGAGTTLTRNRLAPKRDAGIEVETVAQDEAAAFVNGPAGGDFDSDGIGDVAAVLSSGAYAGPSAQNRLVLDLGAEHEGARLVGVSKPIGFPAAEVLTADFAGTDEIVLAGPTSFSLLKIQ